MRMLQQEYENAYNEKLQILSNQFSSMPQECWILKCFVQPMAQPLADQVIQQHLLSRSFQSFGSAALQRAGLSFSERQHFKLRFCANKVRSFSCFSCFAFCK